METIEAERWCDDSLKEWERAGEEFAAVQNAPKGEGESTLLRSARERRAKAKLDAAAAKASLAILVQQAMHDAVRGSITFEVPAIQLEVRLTW